jgi:Zn-dependent M28 family amino/carboxypeptidase
VVLAGVVSGSAAWMLWMPGVSYEGDRPQMLARETFLRDRLRQHVHALASDIGERNWWAYGNLERARLYIDEQLRDLSYGVEHQRFEFGGSSFYNVEARLPGTQGSARSIVVGAHYDSVEGSPGANDNASGIAALLELARELRGSNLPLTIRFVAFTNEEPPFFNTLEGMGSIEYLRRMDDPAATVVAMVSLETIGFYSDAEGSQAYPPLLGLFYPNKANFIAFVGNLRSRKLVRSMVRSFRGNATIPSEGIAAPPILPGLSWSDHRSFWQAGIPAVMVTDTALFRDPEYHLETDTPERLDYDRMARVVSGLTVAITAVGGG